MATLWVEGFDHYGAGTVGAANMLAGTWAQLPSIGITGIDTPAWGARTGQYSFKNQDDATPARRVLPASTSAVIVAMGYSVDFLPALNNQGNIVSFRDSGNLVIAQLICQSTGALSLQDTHNTVIVEAQNPIILAEDWQFLEMKIDISGGTFRLDVDGTTVINANSLSLGSNNVAQIGFLQGPNGTGTIRTQWMDDVITRDTSGSRNNDFEGDLRVATLFPDSDGAAQGWTPRPRKKIGTGILNNTVAGSGVAAMTATATNLGSGDFTIESFVRFLALPTVANKAVIFGKWDEVNNHRSYQLYLGGPSLDSGFTTFRISTDGLAGTVAKIISWPWAPELDQWYHVAIVRTSGETLFFIDGIQQGLPVADTNTYFVGAEVTALGVQIDASSVTAPVTANTSFQGFMDEFRLTVGFARYTSDFTPTVVAFPRNVGGDPEFAQVAWLSGFDNGLFDESSFGRTLTAAGSAAAYTPDDGDFAYQTINEPVPIDDNFIEAPLTPATGILTFSATPGNGETVTVGTYTSSGSHAAVYTFKTAISTAFDVLIGASATTALASLVAAINLASGAGTTYGTGTVINNDVVASTLPATQMLVTATVPGTAGNSIASTETLANGAWGGSTLAGGIDIPGFSEFGFQRPPNETTVIKSVTIVQRSLKTDSGTCKVKAALVGALGGVEQGTEQTLTTSASYYQDTFETDPDTAGDLTPSTIISCRARFNRTA